MHMLALAGNDGFELDAVLFRIGDDGHVAIDAQQHIVLGQHAIKRNSNRLRRAIWQHSINLIAMPVACDQHRGLFVRKPRLFGLAAAFARLSCQPALTFAAFQNKTLIDLDNAGKLLFQRVFVQAQKTVAPAERGVLARLRKSPPIERIADKGAI